MMITNPIPIVGKRYLNHVAVQAMAAGGEILSLPCLSATVEAFHPPGYSQAWYYTTIVAAQAEAAGGEVLSQSCLYETVKLFYP